MPKKISIRINKALISKLNKAIKASLSYEKATNGKRRLGITGEVGELLVCYHLYRKLGLRLVTDSLSAGFDAVDRRGKKVQIKSRRSESEGLPKLIGRTGRFSDHKFDYALLAILGRDYKLVQVWKLSYRALKPIIDKDQRRSGPRLKSFIKKAELIFGKVQN